MCWLSQPPNSRIIRTNICIVIYYPVDFNFTNDFTSLLRKLMLIISSFKICHLGFYFFRLLRFKLINIYFSVGIILYMEICGFMQIFYTIWYNSHTKLLHSLYTGRLNFGEFSRKWGGFDFSKNKTSVNRLAYAIYTPQKKTQMTQYGPAHGSERAKRLAWLVASMICRWGD